MPELAPELLVLVPLAVAAGIDLYLTLLLLGASPTIGLWDAPLPGALGDLDSPGVLIVVGASYVLEFAAERYPPAALIWNAFHAVIRPVSGALLALLILDGQPLGVVVLGALAAGLLASLAHAARSGGAMVRWLGSAEAPSVLLVSLLEDAIVLGIVALTLDLPGWATGATAVFCVGFALRIGSDVRAFIFAVRLTIARIFRNLVHGTWLDAEGLPDWVRSALADDDDLAAGSLRGSPVAAHRIPGAPNFLTGWLLVRGGRPVLVFRRRGSIQRVGLGDYRTTAVLERAFFRRVDLDTDAGQRGCVFFRLDGPSVASLRAEFPS